MDGREACSILALILYLLFYAFLVLLFLLWFFCVLYKCCGASAAGSTGTALTTGAASFSGVDAPRGVGQSVIETFPKFAYSSEEAEEGKMMNRGETVCAVCLGAFEEHETLRLLPQCGHVFHAQCVDAWLLSHATCPCCRADVLPRHLPLPVGESIPGGVSGREVAP